MSLFSRLIGSIRPKSLQRMQGQDQSRQVTPWGDFVRQDYASTLIEPIAYAQDNGTDFLQTDFLETCALDVLKEEPANQTHSAELQK